MEEKVIWEVVLIQMLRWRESKAPKKYTYRVAQVPKKRLEMKCIQVHTNTGLGFGQDYKYLPKTLKSYILQTYFERPFLQFSGLFILKQTVAVEN